MAKSVQITARISTIAKELANGKKRADIMPKYAKKWGISETSVDRYITNAKKEAQERRNLAEKTANDTLVAETKEAVKQGLKSKLDRVMFYQNEIDKMEAQLRGGVEFTFMQGSAIKKSHSNGDFMLPVQIQNELRKTIHAYQTEISKIEGDYAATKVTTPADQPFETKTTLDYSKLPAHVKDAILAAAGVDGAINTDA
jgi:hypothetical protein